MIEALVLLAALIALGWVLLWSMIQEKVRPGKPSKGFFAMKHDLHLDGDTTEPVDDVPNRKLNKRHNRAGRDSQLSRYDVPRGRHHRR